MFSNALTIEKFIFTNTHFLLFVSFEYLLVWIFADLVYHVWEQGYLDEQFCQVEDLQDEASPNFAEEVVSLFFKDSARLVTNIEQAM
jgi:hypothetical protein